MLDWAKLAGKTRCDNFGRARRDVDAGTVKRRTCQVNAYPL